MEPGVSEQRMKDNKENRKTKIYIECDGPQELQLLVVVEICGNTGSS